MRAMLWRLLFALFCFVVVIALIPPVMSLIGISIAGNVEQIIRICAFAIGVLYVVFGPPLFPQG